ncbi:tetratricopeptide repeat protein [Vibrio vulnificus]|uniref:tetratricopeptide repeat protein n=1 Tax=Vibrio vulnificus TaxID=672 RepID=UPI0010351FEA|nr:tetratricopeptide repeat protein [Vibrio vulnificus]EJI1280507.1 tetratricopeptide repeat protein [Vibrio vulnificus]ELI3523894.1 tetratricopeptide repeat protein [Vibrio vulnificus]MBN8156076.1 tetratricopeptide repeat protein [Vibrio vulnificus]QBH26087.1 MSHA biogenesis protein MshN [Vibrio vulnificus]HAS6190058.1 tetratricopeptide repeat protein [Vibrio vulnificus]
MSEINKALAELASQKSQPAQLQRAELPKVTSVKPIVWIVTGFGLSLAVGGWAITQSAPVSQNYSEPVTTTVVTVAEETLRSPTQKTPSEGAQSVTVSQPNIVTTARVEKATSVAPSSVKPAPAPSKSETTLVAKAAAKPSATENQPVSHSVPSQVKAQAPAAQNTPAVENSMLVEQVELTQEQLAEKAIGRAEKALDANNLQNALSAYSDALRHTPNNEVVRQKLAALYFGKGDSRKAYELLQAGIALNPEGETLRIALSKMLIKANQNEAALTPLVALYDDSGKEYLAMRAALAQKIKKDDIALESYQRLSQMDSENARWWLGLAIQQERALDFKSAQVSYQAALSKVGISNQSQRFIKDRLALLQNLESAQ